MAAWCHPATTHTFPSLSLPPPPSRSITHIHRLSFSGIAYPTLSYSSTTLLHVKSSNYNVQVVVEEDEPEDQLVHRFRKEVLRAGILQECRRRRFFETPQAKVKRKAREASRRNRKWPYSRILAQNKDESPNKEKDDDGEEEDNWELSDVPDLPYC
uniref:30S ribosomal protein S21, chloroplastic isoform X2 n=1 Tax=Cicer arietinum TaxID=3827 RepID=A0A3Q7Y781_CICAR|nr:30S ribosomal protein S21, chloroplastic isoform X2 [Cicer arietinum]